MLGICRGCDVGAGNTKELGQVGPAVVASGGVVLTQLMTFYRETESSQKGQ